MRYLKRFEAWADRKFETYYVRPFFRSYQSLLTTMMAVVALVLVLGVFMDSQTALTRDMQVRFVILMILTVGVWLGAYMQHRRIGRLLKENKIERERLLTVVASSSLGFILFSYLILLFSLQLIWPSLKAPP